MMPSCDQTGMPHFHSSTTFGSASLMSLRILPRVSPRQSPSPAILSEISTDAGGPWLASDFFTVLSIELLIRQHHEDQHGDDRHEESERARHAIPLLRLPHSEPFAADR